MYNNMETKITIAELLKDCPKGMELDCTTWENVTFEKVRDDNIFIRRNNKQPQHDSIVVLNEYGCVTNHEDEKCRIFPKGKTTWEGFQRPFKDGDIVANQNGSGTWIGIYHEYDCLNETFTSYCYIRRDGTFYANSDRGHVYYKTRLATEEEKQKFFKVIKDNGYHWNEETKTLEKLPKFKVGDRIKHKGSELCCTLGEYSKGISAYRTNIGLSLTYKDLEQWELVPNKFKVGDRVKHIPTSTSGIVVKVDDKGYYIDNHNVKGICYISFILEKDYELVPDKFDISKLKPFESKVLVRHHQTSIWMPAIFGGYDIPNLYYYAVGGTWWKYCIPYKGNEHLRGTTDDCNNYYKTWE